MEEYELMGRIIRAAKEVHRHLGPNFLECSYESCLVYELRQNGLEVKQQVGYPLRYKGIYIESGYRINILVEDKVLVEIRSVEAIYDIHKVKLLTYMRHTKHKCGLVLNFNVPDIAYGIKKIIRR